MIEVQLSIMSVFRLVSTPYGFNVFFTHTRVNCSIHCLFKTEDNMPIADGSSSCKNPQVWRMTRIVLRLILLWAKLLTNRFWRRSFFNWSAVTLSFSYTISRAQNAKYRKKSLWHVEINFRCSDRVNFIKPRNTFSILFNGVLILESGPDIFLADCITVIPFSGTDSPSQSSLSSDLQDSEPLDWSSDESSE